MTAIIAPYGGYRKMLSFGFTCLAYHATETFCARNFDYRNDPLGKMVGQMVGAARSARQNLVEASSRAGTSAETELRLLDVAKASLQELAGDYEAFLQAAMRRRGARRRPGRRRSGRCGSSRSCRTAGTCDTRSACIFCGCGSVSRRSWSRRTRRPPRTASCCASTARRPCCVARWRKRRRRSRRPAASPSA